MKHILVTPWHTWSLILGHLVLWMLGVVGIVLAGRQISASTAAAMEAQEAAAAAATSVQTVDGMLDGVIITDLRGRITHINKALTDYFGWGQEVLGELATKLVVDRDSAKILPGLTACLEQGYARDLDCDLLTKDRREVPVLVNASRITDPQGRPMGVIWVIRDITALRQAETGPGGRTAASPISPGGVARLCLSEGPGLFHQVCQPVFPGKNRGPRRPAMLSGVARLRCPL
jgi:PAS domain S-box-containing protein